MRRFRPAIAVPLLLALIAALAVFGYRLTTTEAVPQVITEVAIDTNVDDNGDQGEDGTQKAPGTNECYDRADNDADTLIDGADPDCQRGLFLDNDDSTISAADYCVQILPGQTAVVDLWVDDVDVADRIKGYQYDIDYDPAVIGMGIDDDADTRFDEDCSADLSGFVLADGIDDDGDTSTDEEICDYIAVDAAGSVNPNNVTMISAIASAGGAGFLNSSDTSTTANSVTFAAADGTSIPAPPNNHEWGDGVLARFTVTGVAGGFSPLTIPSVIGGPGGIPDSNVIAGTGPLQGSPIPINAETPGLVAVGLPCPYVVDTTSDANLTACTSAPADCSLRGAITNANNNAGTDFVYFGIGAGAQTIAPGSALPTITDPVTIDGTTQPGFSGTPIIELDGSGAGTPWVDGLHITGGSSTVKGLVINNFSRDGIRLSGSGGNTIEGNYIGTDVNGAADLGNGSAGVYISDVSNNTIGGTAAGAGNLISGNSLYGVQILGSSATYNKVEGNYIGTDVNGTADLGNGSAGVRMQNSAHDNTIGGTTTGASNLISGNNSQGVDIFGSGVTGNKVQGNYIGTDVNGTAPVPNGYGVLISDAPSNTIGGTAAWAGNLISGNNDYGIYIYGTGTATGNLVQANYIGTDATGTVDLGNTPHGIRIWGGSNNTIGGTVRAAANTIAFNGGDGVRVDGASTTGNTIRGNSIHSNGGNGIGNTTVGATLPPVVTAAGRGAASGTACANCTVAVHSDDADEGRIYHGSDTADGSGNWSFSGAVIGPNVTATATDSSGNGNTSEFSAPFQVGKMYFTDFGTDKIQWADMCGTPPCTVHDLVITGLILPTGIALDVNAGKMYWTDGDTNKIQRADLNGSNVEDLVTGLSNPQGIALDVVAGKMYWTDSTADKIQWADLGGSNVQNCYTGLPGPIGIALDIGDDKMYWTDGIEGKVQRANLDCSGGIQLLVTGLSVPRGIALDVNGGNMYWVDRGTDKIQRADMCGTPPCAVEDLVTTGLIFPMDIALDVFGSKMYWTDRDTSKIHRANMTVAPTVENLVTGLDDPGGIALDRDADGDGILDAMDNCPAGYNPDQTSPPWTVPKGDVDCDGFSSADEGTIGTDPLDNCPDDGTDDAWPSDFDMNTVINLADVFNVLPPYFGTSVPPTSPRRDLVPSGIINLADVFKTLPRFFGSICTNP